MGLHEGAPRMAPPTWIPARKPARLTAAETYEAAIRAAVSSMSSALSYLENHHDHPLTGYFRAHGSISTGILCLTDAMDDERVDDGRRGTLRTVVWDLVGVRSSIERIDPLSKLQMQLKDTQTRWRRHLNMTTKQHSTNGSGGTHVCAPY